jgi:hypothetical protein
MKTTKTTRYNYFYYVWRIPRAEFEKEVPENWEKEVVNGIYRWGGYKAIQIN